MNPTDTTAVDTAKQKVTAANDRLMDYSADLPSQIRMEINKAWTPTLESSARATQNQMADFLPRYFNMASEGPGMGTTMADVSPQKKLAMMGSELGNMGGQLNYSTALTDYLGGQVNQMGQNALEGAKFGYQVDSDTYSRAMSELQMEEDAKRYGMDYDLRQRQFEEDVNQFGLQYAMQKEQFKESQRQFNEQMAWDKAKPVGGGAGGFDTAAFMSVLESMGLTGGGAGSNNNDIFEIDIPEPTSKITSTGQPRAAGTSYSGFNPSLTNLASGAWR